MEIGTTWLIAWATGVTLLAGEWIHARDKVTDPLWERICHLVLLLGHGALICTLFAGIVWLIL